ncbi:MAG TPA: aldo/keto reductase [Myxococcales bacterium]|nr:aldo/keto reductase [Deltaproteobacteria bacterium]MBU47496.1 aldo/keto reductase [Deltaproteobacteria bacterium]HAA53296.1 aldo/keto reductase [Myxococcales bacterium]|tara:strand:- start:1395 stop:2378 length:984 start_codon:yes stop_codon:yes gene_type:complete
MKKRVLGKTGVEVSEVGLGAWQLGADWGSPLSIEEAHRIISKSVEHGVTLIDTADVYGAGRSETIIGEAKKHMDGSLFVATKQGRAPGWEPTYEVMKEHALASCQRLQVETLDLLQLHCIPFSVLQQGDVFLHLERLQKEGIIRFAGVSVESVEEGLFCLQQPVVSMLQVIFNIFRQKLVDALLPQAAEANVGLFARVPLASGLLAGKWTQEHRFRADDHRSFNANGECFNVGETFAGLPFSKGVALADEVKSMLMSEEADGTMAQRALRWVLDHPAISAVIPGASSLQQAEDNALVSGQPSLTEETHQELRAFYSEHIASHIRGPY